MLAHNHYPNVWDVTSLGVFSHVVNATQTHGGGILTSASAAIPNLIPSQEADPTKTPDDH
jgi:hypothetical protein